MSRVSTPVCVLKRQFMIPPIPGMVGDGHLGETVAAAARILSADFAALGVQGHMASAA